MDSRWEKLTELLKNETFPLAYTFKLIGRNTAAFQEACLRLMNQFPGLSQSGTRATSSAQSVSFSFAYTAQNADEIVAIYQAAQPMPDLLILL